MALHGRRHGDGVLPPRASEIRSVVQFSLVFSSSVVEWPKRLGTCYFVFRLLSVCDDFSLLVVVLRYMRRFEKAAATRTVSLRVDIPQALLSVRTDDSGEDSGAVTAGDVRGDSDIASINCNTSQKRSRDDNDEAPRHENEFQELVSSSSILNELRIQLEMLFGGSAADVSCIAADAKKHVLHVSTTGARHGADQLRAAAAAITSIATKGSGGDRLPARLTVVRIGR